MDDPPVMRSMDEPARSFDRKVASIQGIQWDLTIPVSIPTVTSLPIIAALPIAVVPLPVITVSIPMISIIAAVVSAAIEVTPAAIGPETISIPVAPAPSGIEGRRDDHRSRRIVIRVGGINRRCDHNTRRRNLLRRDSSLRHGGITIVGIARHHTSREQENCDRKCGRSGQSDAGE